MFGSVELPELTTTSSNEADAYGAGKPIWPAVVELLPSEASWGR